MSVSVYAIVFAEWDGMTFLEQRHRPLFNFKVVRLKLLLGKWHKKTPSKIRKSWEVSVCSDLHSGKSDSKYAWNLWCTFIWTTEMFISIFFPPIVTSTSDLTSNYTAVQCSFDKQKRPCPCECGIRKINWNRINVIIWILCHANLWANDISMTLSIVFYKP